MPLEEKGRDGADRATPNVSSDVVKRPRDKRPAETHADRNLDPLAERQLRDTMRSLQIRAPSKFSFDGGIHFTRGGDAWYCATKSWLGLLVYFGDRSWCYEWLPGRPDTCCGEELDSRRCLVSQIVERLKQ